MTRKREFPDHPIVGVGGVVIQDDRALLIRRGSEPLKGEWSIPGGMLELGETLEDGVRRELREETGLDVRVLGLIEVFDRIVPEPPPETPGPPRYHYVIADYLCEPLNGTPQPSSDVTELAFAAEDELERFRLTPTATRVLRRAFALARSRATR